MSEAPNPALRARRIEVPRIEFRLRVGRAAHPAREREHVACHAEHGDMAQRSPILLTVLQDVLWRGQGMRHAREIAPSSHQSRPVHVHERVRDVQIFRAQLVEELCMRQSLLPLMQVVYMGVAGVPSARG